MRGRSRIGLCELRQLRIVCDDFCFSTLGLTDPIAEAILELLRLTEDAAVKLCSVSCDDDCSSNVHVAECGYWNTCASPLRHAGLHVLQLELDSPEMTIAVHVAILHSQLVAVKQELFFRAQAGESGRGRMGLCPASTVVYVE